jgi:NAD(P)-dependent dehydrogenase (short-subunit alcohol dehydrogenase family)
MNPYQNTPFDITGRAALVAGAGRGLGKEMARILSQAGAEVVICSRTEAQLRETAQEISGQTGGRVEFVTGDMSVRSEAARVVEAAIRLTEKVDILICNAGFNVPQPVDKIRDEDWDRLLELNLSSCMALTRACAPGMIARKWGRVLYTSSVMAFGSTGDRVAYSATKAALHGMVKANALHLGPHGVTANCIAPGPFATEMPMKIFSEEQKKLFASRTALGRWGEPAELAPTALLLSSEAGSFINGSVFVVDGGVTARLM